MCAVNSNDTSSYWLCPLYSFDCYSDTVDLVNGIQIRRVPREFGDYLLRQYSDWFWIDPSETKYMLVLPQNVVAIDKIESMFDWHVSDLLVNLITAFRLCHAGMVTPGPLVSAKLQNATFSISQFDEGVSAIVIGPSLTSISKEGADLFACPQYEFVQSDVLLVNKFVKNFIKLHGEANRTSSLDIALRRFNSSYHGEFEDRLIDQMIAFESLYIGDDKELGYKLALRTTILLEKDKDKRRAIFSDMKTAYDLRGKVVHGTKQAELSKLEEVIPKTEEYLRQSIRKFLMLHENYPLDSLKKGKNKRLAKLDENVLSNGDLIDTE